MKPVEFSKNDNGIFHQENVFEVFDRLKDTKYIVRSLSETI